MKSDDKSLTVMPAQSAMATKELGGDNILAVIARAAADPTVDVEKMRQLLEMQERIEAKRAEAAFNSAMSTAQQEMPRVHRDAKNPSTNSLYTRLETLNKEAVPIYTKHGFSLSFGSDDCPIADHIRITCVVAHIGGHCRPYKCDLPRDDMGAKGTPNKTKMHGAGSTFSYGRRYLTMLIFNISLTNEDDDGNHGNRPKPAGPSSLAASDPAMQMLVRTLWELMKPVRGAEKTWTVANQWLYREDVLDGAIPEAVPNLSPERMGEVINRVKEILAKQP